MEPRRLFRNKKKALIGGVCQGLGDYFGVDATLIRLIWAAFVIFWGSGLLAYLLAWVIIPEAPDFP